MLSVKRKKSLKETGLRSWEEKKDYSPENSCLLMLVTMKFGNHWKLTYKTTIESCFSVVFFLSFPFACFSILKRYSQRHLLGKWWIKGQVEKQCKILGQLEKALARFVIFLLIQYLEFPSFQFNILVMLVAFTFHVKWFDSNKVSLWSW